MGSILFHAAGLKKSVEYIKQINCQWLMSKDNYSAFDSVKADNLMSHSWLDDENSPNAVQRLIKENYKKEVLDVDLINHWLLDSLTIGQIVPEFWGKIDNKIDLVSEFVTRKDLLCYEYFPVCEEVPIDELLGQFQTYVNATKTFFYEDVKRSLIKFLWHQQINYMVRRAVKLSSVYTAKIVLSKRWVNK
jgi:hypothetical protein